MSTEKAQEVIDTAVQNQPTPPCRWRHSGCRGCLTGCLKICLPIALVLAVPFWWFCLHTTPLRISKETTYITSPLTADGKRIDYFRALEELHYPPEMKTDDNGYRIFVRACGPLLDLDEDAPKELFRLQTYEKLGLDPNIKPTLKVESPDTFLFRASKENPENQEAADLVIRYEKQSQQSSPWTFNDFPALEKWLDENTAGMDIIGEAVRKPVFRIPLLRGNENTPMIALLLPNLQTTRGLARAIKARALYRIGTGNIDGAIDDIITIHRLGRHAGQTPFLISALVGFAIEGIGLSVGINGNPEHPATKEQLERLMKELDALPLRITFTECLESERYYALACFQDMYWGNMPLFVDGHMSGKLYPTLSWSYDFNIALRRWNEMFDAAIDGTFDESKYFKVSFNPFGYLPVRRRTENFCNILFPLMFPAVQAAREVWKRCDCTENIQRLTLALLLYEKEHGKLPEGDWQTAIQPYLGDKADEYFHCPSDAHTAYALVKDGGDLLLVETEKPVTQPEDCVTIPNEPELFKSKHPGSYIIGSRSGAVQSIMKKD